jgi:4-amino-4-deoxy-L-arabinose transferase-like glycosyltransferase
LAIGFATGLVYLSSGWFTPVGAFSEEERVGIHLANGEGGLTPFLSGPAAPASSWCPPVYPAIVGATYHFLGVRSHAAILAILLFNLACRAFAGTAIFWLGRRMLGDLAGVLAAVIFMLSPVFLQTAMLCWDNTLALAIFLWLLIACVWIAEQPFRAGRFAWLGVGIGLLLLTNAAYVLAVPVMLVIAANRKRVHGVTIGTIALLLTLLPWTARNYLRFNQLIFVRGNLYTELWLGNEPGATGWMTMAALQDHPSENPGERQTLLAFGEARYSDLCRTRFVQEISADPGGICRRSVSRAAYLFFGEPSRAGTSFNIILTVLGLAGLWASWRMRVVILPIALTSLAAVMPYVPTQVHDRYVLPLRALLSLGTGLTFFIAIRRLGIACRGTFPAAAQPAEDTRSQSPRMPSGESGNSWKNALDFEMYSIAAAGKTELPGS